MDCKLLTLLTINRDGQETESKNKESVNCPEGMIGRKCTTTIVVAR